MALIGSREYWNYDTNLLTLQLQRDKDISKCINRHNHSYIRTLGKGRDLCNIKFILLIYAKRTANICFDVPRKLAPKIKEILVLHCNPQMTFFAVKISLGKAKNQHRRCGISASKSMICSFYATHTNTDFNL